MLLSLRGFMLLSFLSSFLLLSLANHVNAEPKVVSMQTKRMPHSRALEKRGDGEVVAIGNGGVGYFLNTTIGTPGQSVWLHVDTGSSDTWMFSAALEEDSSELGSPAYFDQNQSSSFVHKEGNFFIKYATPDSGVEGEYFIDDLALGDFKLKQVTMALATKARNVMEGSLGLGIPAGEAYVMSDNATTPYKTVLDEMIGQDLIKSRTFSIWLDSRSADIGNILFGGYDTAKFKGNLSFLDIQPPGNRFTVALTGLWLQVGDNTSDPSTSLTLPKPLPVVLDTGVTDMALPADLFESLAYYFGVTNTDIGYAVPCPTEDLVGEMSFQFGGGDGPVIHVPFSELFRPAHVDWSEVFTTPKEHDKDVCLFGITPSNEIASELLVLGDTFLRSAYVLFDLENSQIGIANALWNATDSNIVELPANGKVKSATTVTGVTVTQTASLLAQVPELFGMTTGSISLATPSSAMLSLPTNGHGAPTSSGSAASSSSASAAVAILEQSTLPVIVLALCGAIMLIATLII